MKGSGAHPRPRRASPWPRISAFALGGALGGLIAGLVDGLAALGRSLDGFAAVSAASMGLLGALGLVLGGLAGALSPLIPPGLGALHLIKAAGARLWPGEDDALDMRCRTVAVLWGVGGLLTAGIQGLGWLFSPVLTKVADPELAALAAALLAFFALAATLLVAAPALALGARLLEWAVRRWPSLSGLSHPALHLVALLAGLFALTLSGHLESGLDPRPLVVAAFGVWPLLLVGAALVPPLTRLKGARSLGLLASTVAGLLALCIAGLSQPKALQVLERDQGGAAHLALLGLRAPFDQDLDGYARALGGGDCDDRNPHIHPGAPELPGNEVDEDCDGKDAQKVVEPDAFAEVTLPTPLNLVLVTVSALRADHVGCYGYGRPTTPALDALAAEAAVFRRAYSPAPRLPAAIAAVLSGRHPTELLRDDRFFPKLGANNPLVAEVLTERGYEAAAFTSHWYLTADYGVVQGFKTVRTFGTTPALTETASSVERLIPAALDHLAGIAPSRSKPFLLWIHLHEPERAFVDHSNVPSFGDAPLDRYDHELRAVDDGLSRLIEALKSRPDWNRTAVVVAGLYGQALGERGLGLSGMGLYESDLKVPLVVRVPGVQACAPTEAVSLVDVAPTLLDLAGMGGASAATEQLAPSGQSFLPLIIGRPWVQRPAYAELPATQDTPDQRALFILPYKLMEVGTAPAMLFDLGADPQEQTDLAPSQLQRVLELKASLTKFRGKLKEQRPTPLAD